jgi:hypothetical protein
LDDAIRILEGNPEKPVDWKNSAFNCLKDATYPLRTIDILNCMFFNEREKLDDEAKKKNYMAALSFALNNQCDKGVLIRTSIAGYKGYFYGLKDWFDKDGKLKTTIHKKLDEELWMR